MPFTINEKLTLIHMWSDTIIGWYKFELNILN